MDVTAQSQVQLALEQDPLLVQPLYVLTNLTLGLGSLDDRYQISLFVRNVSDQRFFNTLTHGTVLAGSASPNDVFAWRPKDASQYVGATLRVRF
jgi:iron complex outermembrane receptor protein